MILCRWCHLHEYDKCLLREIGLPLQCDMKVDTIMSELLMRPCPTCHEKRADLSMPCEHCGEVE